VCEPPPPPSPSLTAFLGVFCAHAAAAAAAATVRTYVEGLKETSAALLDLIAATGLNSYEPAVGGDGDGRGSEPAQGAAGKQPPAKKKLLYDDYLPLPTLLAGIKADRLVKGYFNANPFNYLEGTVNSRLYPKGGILIVGRKAINRSVHGDEVVVQVLPESQWRAPGASVREQEKELKNDDADSEAEDEAEADDRSEGDEDEPAGEDVAEGAGEKMVTGRIIGVAKRNWRPCVPCPPLPLLRGSPSQITPCLSALSGLITLSRPLSLSLSLFSVPARLQLCLPHRRELAPVDRPELGRAADRLCPAGRRSAPSDPAPHPPGAPAPLAEAPRLDRPLGPSLALPGGPLCPLARPGRVEGGRAGESPARVRRPLPAVWQVDPGLFAKGGRGLGRPAQGGRPSG